MRGNHHVPLSLDKRLRRKPAWRLGLLEGLQRRRAECEKEREGNGNK
jgi:hypothetical protein